MKIKRIIAGISALALAASASCMVSAEEIVDITSEISATDVAEVTSDDASQGTNGEVTGRHERPEAKEGEDVVKPEKPEIPDVIKPEKPEKPEISDVTKPEKPEVSEVTKPEKPEKPEISDVTKPEKPEKPEVSEVTKPEKPEVPEVTKPEKPEVIEGEDVVKPEKPGKIDEIDIHKEKKDDKLKEYTQLDFSQFTDGKILGTGYFDLCKKLGLGFNWNAQLDFTPKFDEEGAFSGFTGLINFDVDLSNSNFKSVDGVLFDKDMKILIAYPDAKADEEYTVPEGVEAIADFAFDNCLNLKKINLPQTLRKIGEGAFKNITITGIEIPDNVKKIEKGAFEGAEKLEKVKLPGGLKVIEEDAFKGNKNLKDINVPKKLENVKKGAFDDCTSVDELVKQAIEKYCELVYGDVSKDKVTDLTDLMMVSLKLLDGKDLDEIQEIAADVVDDDVVDIADLATLKQVIMGDDVEIGPKD